MIAFRLALAGNDFSHRQPLRMSRKAEDPAVAKRLWELSECWCGA
jgi:hypothetical protein